MPVIPVGSVGSPDIIAVINGQCIGIELKWPGYKQSDAQREFEGRLRMAGGMYILAYSLEDVVEALKSLGYNLDDNRPIPT